MEDEEGTTLSVKSFLKKIDGEIATLTDRLIVNGMGNPLEDNLLRGKILAYKKAKEILLNKKS